MLTNQKKRQTNYYLPETARKWIATRASEQKISRSVYIYTLIRNDMAVDRQSPVTP